MDIEAWLEVSLIVDGELAEAVAETLSRYLPDGAVVIETTGIAWDALTGNRPAGPLRVCGYIPADEQLDATRQQIEQALWYLGRIQPLPEPVYKTIQNQNWMENWKQHYRPVPVGERLIILPSWYENPDPARLPLIITPGMAFGTGTHPTTQLCLLLMEKWVQPGQAFIDVGCGSGILSIAALRLGASFALGVDTDAPSITSALENIALNQMENTVKLYPGSIAEIRSGKFELQNAPVVAANILATILVRLVDDGLPELATPGGYLLLSGILLEHMDMMQAALDRQGLVILDRAQMEDWVALVVQKK